MILVSSQQNFDGLLTVGPDNYREQEEVGICKLPFDNYQLKICDIIWLTLH
jgi:hypothetical protein